MRPSLKILAAAMLIVFSTPSFADKVTDAIRAGREYYDGNRLSKANRELRYAVAQIARRLAKAYEATMPPAPGGWKARKTRRRGAGAGAFFAGGTIVSRHYRRQDGKGRITAQLAVDNPMMQAFAMMFANPQMATAAGFERITVRGAGVDGLIKFNPDTRRGDAMLLLAGRVFIKLEARGIDSDGVIRTLLQGWNYAELKKVAEIK